MTIFIGMNAPKRTGKDTFAGHLKNAIETETFPYSIPVKITRMARPLYVWAEAVTGWNVDRLMGPEKDTEWTAATAPTANLIGHSPRSLLIDIGTWAKDRYGEDFLAKTLRRRYGNRDYGFVLVPDIRNDVEAASMDFMYYLRREGFSFEGGRTESPLKSTGTTITLKTTEDTSQAADYQQICSDLLTHFKAEA